MFVNRCSKDSMCLLLVSAEGWGPLVPNLSNPSTKFAIKAKNLCHASNFGQINLKYFFALSWDNTLKIKKVYSHCLPLENAKLCLKIMMFEKFSLVPNLATREAVAPLANDHIMLDRLIWLFRHLKYQNLFLTTIVE